MKKLFPIMYTKPESSQILGLILCWSWVFIVIPVFMPFLADGLWDILTTSVWFEIVYHIVNGVIVLLLIRSYLKEEWFMLTTDVKHCLKHVALTVGLILGTELLLLCVVYLCGFDIWDMLNSFPVSELSVVHTSLSMLYWEPIIGTVILVVFVPLSICGLFYCLCFAPIGNSKPWLAYLSIPVITLFPVLVDILWRWEDTSFIWTAYLVQLPVHLLACWSYQKTNNVWTPLLSLVCTNLLLSIVLPLCLFRDLIPMQTF